MIDLGGKFISLEGFEACGKTTMMRKLKEQFPEAVFIKEPGTTEVGKELRRILKHSEQKLEKTSELYLFVASMIETSYKVIRPALAEGKAVFTDRWYYSTIAYQLFPYGVATTILDQLVEWGSVCHPNLNIILSLSMQTALERMSKRGGTDNYESRDLSYLSLVNLYYDTECQGAAVDASRPVSEVYQDILKVIAYE